MQYDRRKVENEKAKLRHLEPREEPPGLWKSLKEILFGEKKWWGSWGK